MGGHFREVGTVAMIAVSVVVGILTISERLNSWTAFASLAVLGSIGCLYVIFRKIPSVLDPHSTQKLFSRQSRAVAVIALVVFTVVIAVTPVFFGAAPKIERIIPIDPVAGQQLQLFGTGLPAGTALEMWIGEHKVTNIAIATADYFDVLVPDEVSSGPIVIIQRRTLLPDFRLYYPLKDVQNLNRDVVLLTREIRRKENGVRVHFAIHNTMQNSYVKVDGIRLQSVVVEDMGSPNYQHERIDLGVHVLDPFAAPLVFDLQTQIDIQLLEEDPIRLEARQSDDFVFQLDLREVQSKLRFIFVIVLDFVDESGREGRICSNRLFVIETGNLGFKIPGDLLMTRASVEELKERSPIAQNVDCKI